MGVHWSFSLSTNRDLAIHGSRRMTATALAGPRCVGGTTNRNDRLRVITLSPVDLRCGCFLSLPYPLTQAATTQLKIQRHVDLSTLILEADHHKLSFWLLLADHIQRLGMFAHESPHAQAGGC